MSFYDTQPVGLNEDNPNAFWWPTPPFAAYPKVQHSIGPLPSGIEGLNGKPNRIHLLRFDIGQEHITVWTTRYSQSLYRKAIPTLNC
jgi:hypothetical protein